MNHLKTGNYIQQPIDIGVCGVNLRPPTLCTSRHWLNYFSRAEGVPKAIENTWKCVVFIILYLFCALIEVQHIITHTHDRHMWLFVLCQCSIVEKSPREGSEMGGYALEL